MRTVQTFILRLLVDPDEPDVLRGALQPMPEGEPQPFTDEAGLLALLHRYAAALAALGAVVVQPLDLEDEEELR